MSDLETAVALWNETRDPAVAELTEVLPAPDATLPNGKSRAAIAAWEELAASGDPADLPTLLDHLDDAGSKPAITRLAGLPDDPRLAARIVAWFEAPPWSSKTAQPFFKTALQRLIDLEDPRSSDPMKAACDGLLGAIPTSVGEILQRHVRRRLPELESSLRRELTSTEKAWLGEQNALHAKALGERREEARARAAAASAHETYLGAIAENPHDDGLKLVYADALLERDDPRGLFIQLQFSGEDPEKQEALREAWGSRWEGDLGPALTRESRWRKGFLDRVFFWGNKKALPKAVGHPNFATVRGAKIYSWSSGGNDDKTRNAIIEILSHPVMRSLDELWKVPPGVAARIGSRWRALGVEMENGDDLAALVGHTATLERLRLWCLNWTETMFSTLAELQPQTVHISYAGQTPMPEIVGRLERIESVTSIRLGGGDVKVDLARETGFAAGTVRQHHSHWEDESSFEARRLADLLRDFTGLTLQLGEPDPSWYDYEQGPIVSPTPEDRQAVLDANPSLSWSSKHG